MDLYRTSQDKYWFLIRYLPVIYFAVDCFLEVSAFPLSERERERERALERESKKRRQRVRETERNRQTDREADRKTEFCLKVMARYLLRVLEKCQSLICLS